MNAKCKARDRSRLMFDTIILDRFQASHVQ
jgi:hypothetical protein